MTSVAPDVVVIGGGIIGSTIALRLAQENLRVTVLDQSEPGREASGVAAGILSPQAESNGPTPFFQLAHASRALYPSFADELRETTGVDVELRLDGVVAVAETEAEEIQTDQGDDGADQSERREADDRRQRVGEDVTKHHREIAFPLGDRGGDIVSRLLAVELTAHVKTDPDPGEQRQDADQGPQCRLDDGADDHDCVEERNTGPNLDQPLTIDINTSTEEAEGGADGHADEVETGVVAYSNEVKRRVLGVDPVLLKTEGAVSEAVAVAMAEGARRVGATDIGIGVTGVAGPGGGSDEKPVGTVWVALASERACVARRYQMMRDRARNKELAAHIALDWLRRELLGLELPDETFPRMRSAAMKKTSSS